MWRFIVHELTVNVNSQSAQPVHKYTITHGHGGRKRCERGRGGGGGRLGMYNVLFKVPHSCYVQDLPCSQRRRGEAALSSFRISIKCRCSPAVQQRS